MASTEEVAHEMYASGGGPGPARLPADWRQSCKPSVELYEKSVTAIVRAYNGAGEGEFVKQEQSREGSGSVRYTTSDDAVRWMRKHSAAVVLKWEWSK